MLALGDQVVRQMIGVIQILQAELIFVEIDPRDAGIVEAEPPTGFAIRDFQERGQHPIVKRAVRDHCYPIVCAAVPGVQVGQKPLRPHILFIIGFNGAIPPTSMIETIGQHKVSEACFKIGAGFTGQPDRFTCDRIVEVNPAGFVQIEPRDERQANSVSHRRGRRDGPNHQAGVDVREAEPEPIGVVAPIGLEIPIGLCDVRGELLRLSTARLGQLGIFVATVPRAGLIVQQVVNGLSVSNEIELHDGLDSPASIG